MKTMKIKAALLLGILLSAVNVHALTFPLDIAYVTPTIPPVGTSPWLQAIFEDIAPNSVRLTMAATGLSAGTTQSVGNWLFNFTDTLSLGLLQLQYASGDEASIFFSTQPAPSRRRPLLRYRIRLCSWPIRPWRSIRLLAVQHRPLATDQCRIFQFRELLRFSTS